MGACADKRACGIQRLSGRLVGVKRKIGDDRRARGAARPLPPPRPTLALDAGGGTYSPSGVTDAYFMSMWRRAAKGKGFRDVCDGDVCDPKNRAPP